MPRESHLARRGCPHCPFPRDSEGQGALLSPCPVSALGLVHFWTPDACSPASLVPHTTSLPEVSPAHPRVLSPLPTSPGSPLPRDLSITSTGASHRPCQDQRAPFGACACDRTGAPRSGSPPTPGWALVEKSQKTHTLSPGAGTVGREALLTPAPRCSPRAGSVLCLHSQACPATAWPALSPALRADGVQPACSTQRATGEPVPHTGVPRPGTSSGGDSTVWETGRPPSPPGLPCHSG